MCNVADDKVEQVAIAITAREVKSCGPVEQIEEREIFPDHNHQFGWEDPFAAFNEWDSSADKRAYKTLSR